MEAYAMEIAKPYEGARVKFGELVDRLVAEEGGAMEHGEVEALIERESREVSRRLLEAHLNARGEQGVVGEVTGTDEVSRTHHRTLARDVESVFGTVRVWREGYGQRGVESLVPVDGHLNLPGERHSHGVSQRLAEEVSKSSYDEGVEAIRRHTGAVVSKRTALELVKSAAADFDAFYQTRETASEAPAPGVPESKGKVLALTADGKGVVMRKDSLRAATRKQAENSQPKLSKRLSKGEKRGRKRMSTVAAVYTVAPFSRTAEQVASELAPAEKTLAPRPRPENKRVWASLEKTPRQVLTDAFEEAGRRDPEHRMTWVALVDGNLHQINVFKELAASFGVTLVIVLDLIHVVEYLWKAAWAFFDEGDPRAQAWVSERLLRLLKGDCSQVAAGIRRSATRRGLEGQPRKAVDTCCDYLLKYKALLHYDQYLAAGLPIGTGVIEGACRYLVKDRMDITGARWSLPGAEAVLKLRALRKNGDFDAYWRFHLAREKERNHLNHYEHGLLPPIAQADTAPPLRSTKVPYLQLVQ